MRGVGVVAAAALCVALTGCGGDDALDAAADGPSPQPATGTVTDSAAPATADPASPTAQPEEPVRAMFGKAFVYAGGLTVRVDPPRRFTPSEWVERQDGTPMRFSVTLRNKTGEEFNPSQLHLRLRAGFDEAVQIFDYEQGVVARPEDRIGDGRTVRFAVAYWVNDRQDLVMELAPGFEYQSTLITS